MREPSVYGQQSFESFIEKMRVEFPDFNLPVHQTNQEGQYIDWIQSYQNTADALILNPGAYTHTSIAIGDAVASVNIPMVEIHISAVRQRESYRQISYIKDYCMFRIEGLGLAGYQMALSRLSEYFLATNFANNPTN